jgi:hypothetical protein
MERETISLSSNAFLFLIAVLGRGSSNTLPLCHLFFKVCFYRIIGLCIYSMSRNQWPRVFSVCGKRFHGCDSDLQTFSDFQRDVSCPLFRCLLPSCWSVFTINQTLRVSTATLMLRMVPLSSQSLESKRLSEVIGGSQHSRSCSRCGIHHMHTPRKERTINHFETSSTSRISGFPTFD